MFVIGLDLGATKQTAYAKTSSTREKIIEVGLIQDVDKFMERLPPVVDLIAVEKMYVDKNRAVALALEELKGQIKAWCKIKRFGYMDFLGATWQQPIKSALGWQHKPMTMTEQQWTDKKYSLYKMYVDNYLDSSVRIIGTKQEQQDQIAACCIAIHALKLAKVNNQHLKP